MKQENRKSMESLVWACHLCGMFSIFIGLSLSLFNLISQSWMNMQASLYILVTGYALIKISSKIEKILLSEPLNQ